MKRFQQAYNYLYQNSTINSKTDLAKIIGVGHLCPMHITVTLII